MKRALSHDEMKVLAADVARLSNLLTRERESLPAAYLIDRGLREAYEAYYLPSNLRKIHTPLGELALHPGKVFEKDTLRVLDLGCGPGTAMLGVMDFFGARTKRPRLEFTAVDHVGESLRTAEELFTASKSTNRLEASLKTVRSSIEHAVHLAKTCFDLIILSNVLNEVFGPEEGRIAKRTALASEIITRLLGDEGSCIIIEPALRETSRDLLAVRDGLLARGFHLYSPCLRHADCPALANPKDWCHEDIPWDPPALIRELDELTGLRKDSLKFSYLVLRKDRLSLLDVFGENAFRVVSEPLVSKGKIEFHICGAPGRRLATLLDKDETAQNEDFRRLQRGAVVRLEGLIDDNRRYKAGKETRVRRLGRAAALRRHKALETPGGF